MDRAYVAAACLVLAIAAALPELAQTNLGKRITIDVTDAAPQIANLRLLPHEPSRVVAHICPVAAHKGHFVVRQGAALYFPEILQQLGPIARSG